jgi:hypothetical protein
MKCWSCPLESSDIVTYSKLDGIYCPKCRDRYYNNYELVCIMCNKRYIKITKREGRAYFNRHCSVCDEIIMQNFLKSFEW